MELINWSTWGSLAENNLRGNLVQWPKHPQEFLCFGLFGIPWYQLNLWLTFLMESKLIHMVKLSLWKTTNHWGKQENAQVSSAPLMLGFVTESQKACTYCALLIEPLNSIWYPVVQVSDDVNKLGCYDSFDNGSEKAGPKGSYKELEIFFQFELRTKGSV